jgi:hypothetical protein
MMSTTRRTDCPDCGHALVTISLLDQGQGGFGDLRYILGGAKPEMGVLGRISVSPTTAGTGKVRALMCGSCGRILLYGEAHAAER